MRCSPDPRGAWRCRNRPRNACNACTYTPRLRRTAASVTRRRPVRAPHTGSRLCASLCRARAHEYSARAHESCTTQMRGNGTHTRLDRVYTQLVLVFVVQLSQRLDRIKKVDFALSEEQLFGVAKLLLPSFTLSRRNCIFIFRMPCIAGTCLDCLGIVTKLLLLEIKLVCLH